jgi:hypothetical protein
MTITINNRQLELGTRNIDKIILCERMSHDFPPIGTVVSIASNARLIITSASTVRAENLDADGAVTATRDNTLQPDQMLKIRDMWAIAEASMAIIVGAV